MSSTNNFSYSNNGKKFICLSNGKKETNMTEEEIKDAERKYGLIFPSLDD